VSVCLANTCVYNYGLKLSKASNCTSDRFYVRKHKVTDYDRGSQEKKENRSGVDMSFSHWGVGI
jgi:hypothetical protein